MASCDLCGNASAHIRAKVEEVEMSVCKGCAKFGQVLGRPSFKRPAAKNFTPKRENKPTQKIVKDYAQKIRKVRQEKDLTQEEFAKLLNEKYSIVHKMESGSFRPGLSLAKKMERLLSIKLIELDVKEQVAIPKVHSSTLTIGDFIKKK